MTKFFNYLVKSFKILVAITISKINSTFSYFFFSWRTIHCIYELSTKKSDVNDTRDTTTPASSKE